MSIPMPQSHCLWADVAKHRHSMEQPLSPRPNSASWFVPTLLSFLILPLRDSSKVEVASALCVAPHGMLTTAQAVMAPPLLNSQVLKTTLRVELVILNSNRLQLTFSTFEYLKAMAVTINCK